MREPLVRRWHADWTPEQRDEAVAAADEQAAWALHAIKNAAAEVEQLAQRFADATNWAATIREMRSRAASRETGAPDA